MDATTKLPACPRRGYHSGFQKAVFQGNLDLISKIARSDPEVLTQRIPFSDYTMLIFAIGSGMRPHATAQLLISLSAELGVSDTATFVNERARKEPDRASPMSISEERLRRDETWKSEQGKIAKLLRESGFSE